MPSVTITITDTPEGGVSIHTDFKPAVGNPCSPAQSAALDIISRTRKHYGLHDKPKATMSETMAPVVAMFKGLSIGEERGR
jgi:hypothetical protein